MRKLIVVLLMAILCITVNADAQMNRFNQDQKILVITNVNAGLTQTFTDITTATVLVPGVHRILGYTVSHLGGGGTTEIYGTLYDAAATTDNLAPATVIAEAESYNLGPTAQVWFPYPREITNGIIVGQGSRTSVTVYYEDYRR
jgi:hypothetical protein